MPVVSPLLAEVRRKAAAARIPLQAQVEITHRCNLHCAHCYLRGYEESENELSTAEWENVFAQLAGLQTMFLSITGGEPLLRPDLFALLASARRHGFLVALLTNGLAMSEATAQGIASCGVWQAHVSVLGPEEIHDRLAGQIGAFSAAFRAMDLLRQHGVTVVGKLVLSRPSLPFAQQCRDLILAHAHACLASVDIAPTLTAAPAPDDLLISPAEAAAFLGIASPTEASDDKWELCHAGRALLAVSPGGNVLPCLMFRRAAGNVRHQPLAEIWLSAAMREVAELRPEDLLICRDCGLQRFCTFCPGRAWLATGNMRQPESGLCRRAAIVRALRKGEAP